MKVFFDSQIFQIQKYGGISRYFSELITALKLNFPEESVEIGAKYVRNNYIVANPELGLKKAPRYLPKRLLLRVDSRRLIPCDANIVHSTYYEDIFLPKNLSIPNVITIHDMIPEDFSNLPISEIEYSDKTKYVLNADGIICVSRYTKERLNQYFPNLKIPIEVIPLASKLKSDFPISHNLSSLDDRTRDFIFVGPRSGYKNFILILDAAEKLRRLTKLHFRIVSIGGGNFSALEKSEIEVRRLSEIVVQNRMNDRELSRAYSTSLALLYPSLSEGFGIPQIEAFSFGCPVISSNLGALNEYGNAISLNFDAASSENLADCMLELLEITPLNFKRISEESISHSRKFSWTETARQTKNFYKKFT
jgi:glycosyltransferase involved in cell wall biosynthesis